MTWPLRNSDFRLTFATDSFIWSKAPRPEFPLLRWPDGTLCEPVTYYFGYSAAESRVKMSSMKPEAYTLREWFVYLANERLSWFDADDELLEKWRTSLGWVAMPIGKKKGSLKPSDLAKNSRIERKLAQVFEFYRNLPYAMPCQWDGAPTPFFVGNNKITPAFPIGLKKRRNHRKKREVDVWVRSHGVTLPPRPPKVPTRDQVIALYNQLRGQGFKVQQQLKTPFPPEKIAALAQRNWLIARTMVGAGLRCEEVSSLAVNDLAISLHESGITENLVDIFAIMDPAERFKIKSRVLSLQESDEFSFLLVRVVGKGPGSGKERQAPFPPQLVCELLDGIWGFRSKQTDTSQRQGNDLREDFIFVSEITKQKLTAGAIGDIIGKAFRACGVRRSAHSLRGYFATVTAALLWKEYFAQNHYHFDQALVNKLMDNLARFMGHSQVTTTIKFYLDQPLFKHLTKIGTPQANLFRRLWQTIVMEKRHLTPRASEILIKLAERVSEAEDESRLLKALEIILTDDRFASTPIKSRPSIHLAYDENKTV